MQLAELSPGIDMPFELPLRRDGAVNMGAFTLPRLQPGRAVDDSKPYQKGDPVRFIDWRSFARTNKLYLREKVENTRVGIEIAVDGSPSMAFPQMPAVTADRPVTKLELAMRLGYFLSYEFASLGEQVTLAFHRDRDDAHEPLTGLVHQSADRKLIKSHFMQIMGDENGAQNGLSDSQHIAAMALNPGYVPAPTSRRFQLVISDALTVPVASWLARFTGSKGVFIHALSHLELDLSWMASDDVYFDHSGQPLKSTGKSFLKYRAKVGEQRTAWLDSCEDACHRHGWTYLQAVDTDPALRFLAGFAALLGA